MSHVVQQKNADPVLVHRLQHSGSPGVYSSQARAPSSPTYWKSPYADERLRKHTERHNASLKGPSSSASSKLKSQVTSNDSVVQNGSVTNDVKGILKATHQTQEDDTRPLIGKPELSPRSAFRKLSAISAGARRLTGGQNQSKASDKRVKFDEKSTALVQTNSSNQFTAKTLPASVSSRYSGFTMGRGTDILKNSRSDFYNPLGLRGNHVHLLSAGTNLSKVNVNNNAPSSLYVKSINVPEKSRPSLRREPSFSTKIAQQRTAEKLRRVNPGSANRQSRVTMPERSPSREPTDLMISGDKIGRFKNQHDQVGLVKGKTGQDDSNSKRDNNKLISTSNVKMLKSQTGQQEQTKQQKSNSVDDGSSSTDSDMENFPVIPNNFGPNSRPKTTASFFTRYNDASFQATADNQTLQQQTDANRFSRYASFRAADGQSLNFCDRGKTHQIIDWLEQVNTAQSKETHLSPNSKFGERAF